MDRGAESRKATKQLGAFSCLHTPSNPRDEAPEMPEAGSDQLWLSKGACGDGPVAGIRAGSTSYLLVQG